METINKMPNKGFRFIAYDAASGEYEKFRTLKEAEDWLTEGDEEGISEESVNGENWIAEIQYVSKVTPVEYKSDYCQCDLDTEDCHCGKDEWPYDDAWDWVAEHSYVKIEWDKIEESCKK